MLVIQSKKDGLRNYKLFSLISIPMKIMEEVLLESMKEKMILRTQHRFIKECINMNLLKTQQTQTSSPASEIQQYSWGASWLERPVCKSRPRRSGRQQIEQESAECLTVRKAHHRLGFTNHIMASSSREVVLFHFTALVKHVHRPVS